MIYKDVLYVIALIVYSYLHLSTSSPESRAWYTEITQELNFELKNLYHKHTSKNFAWVKSFWMDYLNSSMPDSEYKLAQLLWKTVWSFLKKLKTDWPCNLATPLLGIYPDKTIIQKDTCSPIFVIVLFKAAKTWKQPKHPLTVEWIKMWHTYTMEYYSAIKRNEIMPLQATGTDLEIIILSEERERQIPQAITSM